MVGMSATKRRCKHIGRPISLSREEVSHAKRQISTGEETIVGMASVFGVHRNTLRRTIN